MLACERLTDDLRALQRGFRARQDPRAGAPSGTELAALDRWDRVIVEATSDLAPEQATAVRA